MTQATAIDGADGVPGAVTGMDAPIPAVMPSLRWDMTRWGEEIRAAVDTTQKIMARSKIRHDRAGNAFRDGWPEHPDDINNYPFKFVNNFTPLLAYNAPRLRLTSRKSKMLAPIIGAVGLAMNAWSMDANVQDPLQHVAYDLCFDYGVVCVGLEEYEDKHGTNALKMAGQLPPQAPNVADRVYACSVLPNRFIMDPRCSNPDEAEWAGHFEIYDREEFAADLAAGGTSPDRVQWVKDAGSGVSDKLKTAVNRDPYTGEGIGRHEVVVLHLWSRKDKLQCIMGFDGEPGKGTPFLLDDPVPYEGPDNGPYVVFGVYELRGQAFPYAPLAPTDAAVDESNAHRAQMRDDARGAKNVLAVRNTQDAENLNQAPSNSAVPLTDMSDKPVVEVKMGGINETNVAASQMIDMELDAITGLSQAAQGQLGSSHNATEVAEASSRFNMRIEAVQAKFRKRVIEMFKRVLHYFLKTPTVRQFVTVTEQGIEQDAVLVGGADDGGDIDVDDLGLEIVPYSMEYVGEAGQRQQAQELFQNTLALVQAATQFPVGVNWKEVGDRLFDAMNQPEGTRGVIDFAALAQLGQMQMMAAMAPEGGPEATVGPGGGKPGQKPAPQVTQQVRSQAAQKAASTREGKA